MIKTFSTFEHGHHNHVRLPSIPIPLDEARADTAPDGRITLVIKDRRVKRRPTVTPEQMLGILRHLRDGD